METEAITDPDLPLSQGDVLRIISSDSELHNPRFGIIINADCDIVNKKIDNTINYIPLIDIEQYLIDEKLPQWIEHRRKKCIEGITKKLSLTIMEIDSLISWIKTSDQSFEEILKQAFSKQLDNKSIIHIKSLLSIMQHNQSSNYLQILRDICANDGIDRAGLEKILFTFTKSLKDNEMYFNEISGYSKIGYISRLNRICTIPENSIAIDQNLVHIDSMNFSNRQQKNMPLELLDSYLTLLGTLFTDLLCNFLKLATMTN